VEDAIAFYLRYLEGKHPVAPINPVINSVISHEVVPITVQTTPASIDSDDPEEFDGGLEL
jgi:hypothetical protein